MLTASAEKTTELTEKLQEILARFGYDNNVIVSISGVEFHDPGVVVRSFAYVNIKEDERLDEEAIRLSEKAKQFAKKAQRYGLTEKDYLKEVFLYNGKPARLVDCFTNRHKYPFVAEESSGKRWKITKEQAKRPSGGV